MIRKLFGEILLFTFAQQNHIFRGGEFNRTCENSGPIAANLVSLNYARVSVSTETISFANCIWRQLSRTPNGNEVDCKHTFANFSIFSSHYNAGENKPKQPFWSEKAEIQILSVFPQCWMKDTKVQNQHFIFWIISCNLFDGCCAIDGKNLCYMWLLASGFFAAWVPLCPNMDNLK